MEELTPEEVLLCTSVLQKIVGNRGLLAPLTEEQRLALMIAAGRVSRPTRHESVRAAKAFRRVKRKTEQAHDRAARADTHIRRTRQAEVFSAPLQLPAGAPERAFGGELVQPRSCYVCKADYRRLHFFYDSMCGPCAELNYQKRFQSASLQGRVALITGGRIKIGYQAALKMLRAGARVLVTTRFPRDAAQRFSLEADFPEWQQRLQVYGLDLRHLPSVELFTHYLEKREERLDILINNAAQTVRRPAGFYAHLLPFEELPCAALSGEVRSLLESHETCKALLNEASACYSELGRADVGGLMTFRGTSAGIGIGASAKLSQLPCAYEDVVSGEKLFPTGRTDADLQQIDLRTMNSWRLTLAQVPSHEMLEVQLVNAAAPFILASKLKSLMLRQRTDQKHIVNVSAIEGQFSRHTKTDKHPHTNMAKAALNMLTLTSAPDYAADGIFMNAVDTGWVTDEDPLVHAIRKAQVHDFQPPLDIVDGAARICDPFFSGLLSGTHAFGQFLKDYRSAPW